MALSYTDVLDHYDRSKAFGDPRDFQTFTNDMEELHPGQGFAEAGRQDGWWTRLSTRMDQNLFAPVASVTTEPLGAAVGGLFGQEEAGARVGRALPRALLETAPLYALGPEAGVPATAAALGATGALMGAHTYAETGSAKAAALSGALGAALPIASKIGGAVLPSALGLGERVAPTALEAGGVFPGGLVPKAGVSQAAFKTAQFLGSQAAQAGTITAEQYAESRTLGTPFQPFSADYLLQQIPFTAFDLVHVAKAGELPTRAGIEALAKKPVPEKPYVPPTVSQPEAEATISVTLSALNRAYTDPTITPEQKAAILQSTDALINNTKPVTEAAKPGKTVGVPTQVTGYAKQYPGGNWKVLSIGADGSESSVWVNGVEPTRNPDGTYTFNAQASQVSPNVATPLTRSDFGLAEPGQAELPVQPAEWAGFGPDQRQVLEEHGVPPPVPEMPEDVRQFLRDTANDMELSKQKLGQTKANIDTVPQTAEEIPTLVGPAPEPKIKAAVDDGATPTQAVEQTRLQTQTPEYDAAQKQLAMLQERAKVISTTGGVYDVNKPQAQYGPAIRDENGKNFKTIGLAQAFKEADPDLADYVVRNAGKGKGYYLAQQINKEVSLEGAPGVSLENVLPTDPTPIDSRPDVSKDTALQNLQLAARYPDRFSKFLDPTIVTADPAVAAQRTIIALETGGGLDQVNKAVEAAGLEPYVTKRHMLTEMTETLRAVDEFGKRYRTFDMGSEKPYDQATVDALGVQKPDPVRNILQWYIDHPSSGAMGEFVRVVLARHGTDGIGLEVDPQAGTAYRHADRLITLGYLPQADEAFQFARGVAHEYMHDVTFQAYNKHSPTAIRLQASLTEARDALMTSKAIPSPVRLAIDKMPEWYVDYSNDGDMLKLFNRWRDTVGKGYDEWLPFVYATTTDHELVAGMFNSKKVVDMMVQTKMPKRPMTVMQRFSAVWNRLLGTGKAEDDTAFSRVLTSFDNYLSSDRVPEMTISRPNPNVLGITKAFSVIGQKDLAIADSPEFRDAVRSGLTDSNRVVDAFSGSGIMSRFAQQLGFGGEVQENATPVKAQILQRIKTDPDFPNAVQKLANEVVAAGGDYGKIKSAVQNYPDKDAALFVANNTSARGREVSDLSSYIPRNRIEFMSKLGQLDSVVNELRGKIGNVTSVDGWNAVDSAQKGDLVFVDPEYVGGKKYVVSAGDSSVNGALQRIEDHIKPAADRGAKVLYTNAWEPKLATRLQELGFNVEHLQRRGNPPELVATNYDVARSGDTGTYQQTVPYNGRDYLRDWLVAAGVKPDAMASRLATVEQVFNSGSLDASIRGFLAERDAGLLPSTTSIGDVKPELQTALVSGTPKDVSNFTKMLLMSEVPVHDDLYQRMKQDIKAAGSLYDVIRKEQVPGELPPDLRAKITGEMAKLNAMNDALKKQKLAISRWNDLSNFTVEGMDQTRILGLTSDRVPLPPDPTELQEEGQAALGLVDDKRAKALETLTRGKGAVAANFVRKWFMFSQYLKDLVPATKPVLDRLFTLQSQTNLWKNELDSVYTMDPVTKEFDKARNDANLRVATNETLQKAASDIKRWNQTQEAQGLKPSLDDPYVKNILARFNPSDRDAITTEANNAKAVHEHYVEVVTPKYLAEKHNATVALSIALREPGMKPDDARDLAGQFSSALDQLKSPQTAQTGIEMLNALRPRMQPETFLRAFTLTKDLAAAADAHMEFVRSRPNYVTEQRFGDHMLRMVTPDNEPFNHAYPTKSDADAARQRLEAQGYKFVDYIPRSDANAPVGGIREDYISALRELDVQRMNMLAQSLQGQGVDPNVIASVLPNMMRANDFEDSLQAFKPVPGAGFPKRKFIAGREEINMVENQNLFPGRAVNWMRHQLTRAQTELDMLHPDLLTDREMTKQMRDKVTEFLAPDSVIARKISEFTYNWKLGGNWGVNVLHLIQSLNTGMASLISETGSVADALGLTVDAQKAIAQRVLTGKWDNPIYEQLLKNVSGITWEGDVGDSNRNALQYASTPLWRKPAAYLTWAARSWNNLFFKFNDAVGLIAGYEHAKSLGMSDPEAFNLAMDVKNRGYFTGGKAQRPGIWGALGPNAKAVPQLMTSLQTYVNGWFSLLAYNYTRGFGKAPEGMSAAQVLGAKKAFLYQLGAQAVLAGALGLPGVGQGMALVKQTTGVDVMSWLRQHLGEMFDEDQNAGGLMTTLALHGATAAFTPIDISGRHMPSVPYIGVTPYKGFDLTNLAGAPVSGAADLVKGLMAAAKGDIMGASTLLPEVLKGPLRLWQGEGDVRDKSGNLITKLSPSEQFITALGMKPSRVTALQDVSAAVKEANARAAREKSDLTDRLAKVYRQNGPEQGQLAIRTYLQEHPDENGPALVREVSRKIQNQTTIPDWSQRANVAANLAGLGGEPVSQFDRLRQLQATQQSLGLMTRPSRTTADLMREVDLLRQSDPSLSVAEAVEIARSKHPQRRSSGLLLPASQ